MEAIVEAEKIEASDEDIAKEINELAGMYQMPEEQIKRVLTEDMLEHDIKMKKAVELVTGTAVEK